MTNLDRTIVMASHHVTMFLDQRVGRTDRAIVAGGIIVNEKVMSMMRVVRGLAGLASEL